MSRVKTGLSFFKIKIKIKHYICEAFQPPTLDCGRTEEILQSTAELGLFSCSTGLGVTFDFLFSPRQYRVLYLSASCRASVGVAFRFFISAPVSGSKAASSE